MVGRLGADRGQEDGAQGARRQWWCCRKGRAEFCRGASRSQEEHIGGGVVLFKKMGGTWNCMHNGRRDQRAKNPHGFLGPGSQHPSVPCIQHPASIDPARQPCAAWGGLLRGRVDERGSAVSDAPGHWARATHRSRGSHRGSDLSGRQHRRGGGGVVTGGSVLKPFTDQASLWAAQPLSRRPQHPVLPDSGAECLAMRPHKPKTQASWEHRLWACEHGSYFKHSRCPNSRLLGAGLRDRASRREAPQWTTLYGAAPRRLTKLHTEAVGSVPTRGESSCVGSVQAHCGTWPCSVAICAPRQ